MISMQRSVARITMSALWNCSKETPCSMVRTSRAADSMSQRCAASRSSGSIELLQIPHNRLAAIGVTKDCRGGQIDRGDAERRLQLLLEASEPRPGRARARFEFNQ